MYWENVVMLDLSRLISKLGRITAPFQWGLEGVTF